MEGLGPDIAGLENVEEISCVKYNPQNYGLA